nr:MAG TPA: hypothetical protein [Caudoviricetes sp.]
MLTITASTIDTVTVYNGPCSLTYDMLYYIRNYTVIHNWLCGYQCTVLRFADYTVSHDVTHCLIIDFYMTV